MGVGSFMHGCRVRWPSTVAHGRGGEELDKGRSAQPGLDVGRGRAMAIRDMEGVEEKAVLPWLSLAMGRRSGQQGDGCDGGRRRSQVRTKAAKKEKMVSRVRHSSHRKGKNGRSKHRID